jgi:hypothetical protein
MRAKLGLQIASGRKYRNCTRMGNISAVKPETLLRVEERRTVSETKSD